MNNKAGDFQAPECPAVRQFMAQEPRPEPRKSQLLRWFSAVSAACVLSFAAGGLMAIGIDKSMPPAQALSLEAPDTTPAVEVAAPAHWLGLTEASPEKGPLGADLLRVADLPGSAAPGDNATNQSVGAAYPALPRVLIIIDDMGLNQAGTRAAIDLPAPVTLAFLPYAPNVKAQAEAGATRGHEIMLHMPMEPAGFANPGPVALKASALGGAAFDTQLLSSLALYDGFVGLNNHMGSKLTANQAAMDQLMGLLKGRGLIFVDSRTSDRSLAAATARRFGLTAVSRDVFLDHQVSTRAGVERALAKVEEIAQREGQALAIGHPKPATMEVLKEWTATARERGFELVSLTAFVKQPQAKPLPSQMVSADPPPLRGPAVPDRF